jgi:aspartyl-tRNA(Asn)/glutamyl-tRNA(Gln) amidotransferase subunit C
VARLFGKLTTGLNFLFIQRITTSYPMLDEAEVKAIARLARIQINDSEIPVLAVQLSRILELVAQMNAVDTTSVEPLAHPLELVARRRPDVVTETDKREAMQASAPAVHQGYYLVPRVIE